MQKSKGREHWKSRYPWMRCVKEYSKRKNRAATRQLLHHRRYDEIPTNKPVATDDEWNWD